MGARQLLADRFYTEVDWDLASLLTYNALFPSVVEQCSSDAVSAVVYQSLLREEALAKESIDFYYMC